VSKGGKGVKGLILRCSLQDLKQYNTIKDSDCAEIDLYFNQFAYAIENGVVIPGWIYQVRNSVSPGAFLFNDRAFTHSAKELETLDVGTLFPDEKYHWPIAKSDRYDSFVRKLIETVPDSSQKVNTVKENFLAHIYNTITASQSLI
jgi:hypothetical protein